MFDQAVIDSLLNGAQVTVRVTLLAALLGTGLSIASGLAALSPFYVVRAANRAYVEFFRGTSAIVQLFWIFFALPLVGPSLSPTEAAVVTLGLNMGSYGSEVVRGSIRAVPSGQTEAAIALSVSARHRMRYIVFPQAVVAMLPPYGNLLIELLKGTALVSLITLSDLTFEVQKLRVNGTASSPELYSMLLILYFAIALVITGSVRLMERFFGRGLEVGRGARMRMS